MQWLDKQTEKGILKYRMPDILEVYDILDYSGASEIGISHSKMKRNVIKGMSHIIDVSGIEGASSYEDLFSMVDDMMIPLSEIADEIIVKTFKSLKKKNS